jgi:hypothetical protein
LSLPPKEGPFIGSGNQRWSQDFGPFVKVDYLTRKTVLHDKEKESFSRV